MIRPYFIQQLTERLAEWILYNQQIDQIFLILALVAASLIGAFLVAWKFWRKTFGCALRGAVLLTAIWLWGVFGWLLYQGW